MALRTQNPPHHHRASSVPSTTTSAALSSQPTFAGTSPKASPAPPPPSANSASLLQPRVAVALNVPSPWHPWLFTLRLFSVLPALFWGTPVILRLLLIVLELMLDQSKYNNRQHAGGAGNSGVVDRSGLGVGAAVVGDDELASVTEMVLATIWCFACGYLSFFFTDCLMSRWLINYTPQATMVRLLTIDTVNAYVTSTMLSLAGGFQDLRLLLPGWIGIATTLTVCYHITHQKINIRKETSTSVNVFSIASYITMVTLLIYMHRYKPDYPTMPIVSWGLRTWQRAHDKYGGLFQASNDPGRAEL